MIRLLLLAHRWTGIVLAAYVVAMGLTGSALVIHDEAAARFRVPAVIDTGAAPLNADEIVEGIRAAYPDWHLQTLWWPDFNYQRPWFAEIRRGAVGAIGETALAVYVHPQTGEVLRTHNYSRSAWRWMQLLHFNLMSGRDGRTINGVLALSVVFAALTGVLLWWRKRVWWTNTRPSRRWWEWHQIASLYTLPFLLIACFTGSYFAWRADVHRAIALVAPIKFMNQPVATISPVPTTPFKTLVSFEDQLPAIIPDYQITRVLFPDTSNQPLRFVVYEGTRREFYKASNLFFHPSTGALLRADMVGDRLVGDSIIHWIGAVHFGAFGGWPIKLLWMFGGIGLSVSAMIGVAVFVQRR